MTLSAKFPVSPHFMAARNGNNRCNCRPTCNVPQFHLSLHGFLQTCMTILSDLHFGYSFRPLVCDIKYLRHTYTIGERKHVRPTTTRLRQLWHLRRKPLVQTTDPSILDVCQPSVAEITLGACRSPLKLAELRCHKERKRKSWGSESCSEYANPAEIPRTLSQH